MLVAGHRELQTLACVCLAPHLFSPRVAGCFGIAFVHNNIFIPIVPGSPWSQVVWRRQPNTSSVSPTSAFCIQQNFVNFIADLMLGWEMELEERRLSFRQYWGAHQPPEKQEVVEQLMFLSWIVSWSTKLCKGKALKCEEP